MPDDNMYFGLNGPVTDIATEVISGSFALGAGPAIASAQQQNCTIAYTGVGIYTVTLYKTFTALNCATATVQSTANDDKIASIAATDVVTAKTIILHVRDISGAALTDIATDGSQRVNFHFVLVK